MSVEKITSLQNPRLKQLVKLRDRRPRDEAGLFLIEGYREVKRALAAGVKPVELYCGADWFLGVNEPALIEEAQRSGAPVFDLSKEAFAKISYRTARTDCSPWLGSGANAPGPRSGCRRPRRGRLAGGGGPGARASRPIPGSPPGPFSPGDRGDREAGQSRHDSAQRGCGGNRRGHCLRSGDGPLQPECREVLDRRVVFDASRGGGQSGSARLAGRSPYPNGGDGPGGPGSLHRLRSARAARPHHGQRAIRPE